MILTTDSGIDVVTWQWGDLGVPTAGVADAEEVEDYLDDWNKGTQIPRRIKYRMLLDRLTVFEEAVDELAEQLADGRISLNEWETRMAEEIKRMHMNAYVTGRSGSWEDMTSADYGSVGGTVRDQYRYLRRWRNELSQQDEVSTGQVKARGKLYGAAASNSFERGNSAERGLPPGVLPAYPGDGTTKCLTNCKCSWRIRTIDKDRQDFDANWRLGPAEHCETCRKRSRDWLGLRIRGGELVDGYPAHFYKR